MFKDTDLAYVAGLVDGEGCITIKSNSCGHYTQALLVSMTDPAAVEWAQATFGGTFNQIKRATVTNAAAYCWQLNKREEVEQFLTLCLPYLKVKRLAALIVLEFCQRFPKNKTYTEEKRQEMQKYNDYMRVVNARGPEAPARRLQLINTFTGENKVMPFLSRPSGTQLLNELKNSS